MNYIQHDIFAVFMHWVSVFLHVSALFTCVCCWVDFCVCWSHPAGLFHVAIMCLLVSRNKPVYPALTVIFQCVSCITSSWMFTWVARVGEYSVWPPAVMHFVWNLVNPAVLGESRTLKSSKLNHRHCFALMLKCCCHCFTLAPCIVVPPRAIVRTTTDRLCHHSC
jgi:hypothetical protein